MTIHINPNSNVLPVNIFTLSGLVQLHVLFAINIIIIAMIDYYLFSTFYVKRNKKLKNTLVKTHSPY